ncbi:hypothetical protein Ciccas_007960 [Cichlidogyrus casuarinus]|uniref:Uncharacterized protein n=1 Tax=Cichlidogyrus casuarinus TaxID=1844966 RepID=A0ABD2Q1C3_9PLAT
MVYTANEPERKLMGQIMIPLLKIRNGKLITYHLKNDKFEIKSGNITLEMVFFYNNIRAAFKTLESTPEQDYLIPNKKFRLKNLENEHIADIKSNIKRLQVVIKQVGNVMQSIQVMRSWQVWWFSLFGMSFLIILVFIMEIHLLPFGLMLLLALNGLASKAVRKASNLVATNSKDVQDLDSDNENEYEYEEDDDTGKSSTMPVLRKISNILLKVQTSIEIAASFAERCQAPFSWVSYWLSTLAIILLGIISFALYLIPIRILLVLLSEFI